MKKLFLSLFLTFFVYSSAFAACDLQKASAEFVVFTQNLADSQSDVFVKAQDDLQKLAQEINQLASQGKVEEICKKYEDFMKKF